MAEQIVTLLTSYHSAGLSFFPINDRKEPSIGSWNPYRTRQPTADEIRAWQREYGWAIVCGAGSNGVEIIDIDTKYDDSGTLLSRLSDAIHDTIGDVFSRLTVQSTMNGGKHLIYRTDAPLGNAKLALNASGNHAIIETRGEGGYFAAFPTPGYSIDRGSLTELVHLSADERDALWDICRSFSQKPIVIRDMELRDSSYDGKNTPGNDFTNRGDVLPVLRKHGWAVVKTLDNGVVYLRRPDKTLGHSATLHGVAKGIFYNFSSSSSVFESGRAYSQFAVYAILEHGGDFRAAARQLAADGYGEPRTKPPDAETDSIQSSIVGEYLNATYAFRHNVVIGKVEFLDTSGAWQEVKDRDLNSIYLELESARIKCSVEKLDRIINSRFTPLYDPFAEWLSSLPPHNNSANIAGLARTVTVAHDPETWEMYLKRWMTAHIAQLRHGRANHTAIVFKGGQGIGKTTWLNALCPPELVRYRFEGDIDATNKDHQLMVSEKFLINLDELENMQRQDIGHLKSMFTQEFVTVRRPYGRYAEQLPRRASFVGSVNKDAFLTDDTGNRRFLVVEALEFTRHDLNINQCWAEAAYLYESKYKYWFDREEITAINERNEEHRVRSMGEQLVMQYCVKPTTEYGDHFKTATDVARELQETYKNNLNINTYLINDIGKALTRHGYVKTAKKINGSSVRGYLVIIRGTSVPEAQDAPF